VDHEGEDSAIKRHEVDFTAWNAKGVGTAKVRLKFEIHSNRQTNASPWDKVKKNTVCDWFLSARMPTFAPQVGPCIGLNRRNSRRGRSC
jgi:hypothetical protein